MQARWYNQIHTLNISQMGLIHCSSVTRAVLRRRRALRWQATQGRVSHDCVRRQASGTERIAQREAKEGKRGVIPVRTP